MFRSLRWLVPAFVVMGVLGLVALATTNSALRPPRPLPQAQLDELGTARGAVDAYFEKTWANAGVTPAERTDDLALLRRLSLALHGTVPSLQEIRLFEQDGRADRLGQWTRAMLDDPRFGDYFAERLARTLVGVEQGQFLIFRRDQFTRWLAEQLRNNRPYDEMVRQMIAERGLWTSQPAANFVTVASVDSDIDENKLAGRTTRAFLGQRMDCAQCHDHPFAAWKQGQFEGLAAFFGQSRITGLGLHDERDAKYEVEDRTTLEKRTVTPVAPFFPEWMPSEGTQRERLAAWVTHPENRRFERAIVNRVWGLLTGRPWIDPVDDLPDPEEGAEDLLDLLGGDLRRNRFDLKRLIQVITGSRVFQLASQHPAYASGEDLVRIEETWAAFPLTRLRPEQIIGSMFQASSVQTIDQNSHLLTRVLKLIRQNDFVKEFGDPGSDEMVERNGTIPQALLRMNGQLAKEVGAAGILTAAGRIAMMAPNDGSCIETSYLTCLTRRPSDDETRHFAETLENKRGDERNAAAEDLYWTLFNSPEFSWNH